MINKSGGGGGDEYLMVWDNIKERACAVDIMLCIARYACKYHMRIRSDGRFLSRGLKIDLVLRKNLATSALGVCTVAVAVYSLASIR